MNFLKKIFGLPTNDPDNNMPVNSSSVSKKTIDDFFKIDLKTIPDDSFFRGPDEINIAGSTVKNFQKRLNYLECNLFDTIEIKTFDDGSKNVFFKNHDLNSINIGTVKKLIDEFYLLNGKDDTGQGSFNSKDSERFYSTQFDVIFGRNWSEPNKYKYPNRIGIDRSNNEILLLIYGA